MRTKGYESPAQAEAAFYEAFQNADLELMMRVWSSRVDSACIHPGGERLVGPRAIRHGWQQIITNSPPMRFSTEPIHKLGDHELIIHIVDEFIQVGDNDRPPMRILATNAYALEPGGWLMVLHHASAPPLQTRPASGDSVERDPNTSGSTVH